MPYAGINWLAILVAAIVPMIVGMLWYSPMAFATPWMKLIGKTKEEIMATGPAKAYALSFLSYIVMAYVMNYFVHHTASMTFVQGMKIGFALWVGLVVTTNASTALFEFRKWGLYFIGIAYYFVCMLIMGGLLAVWR